MFGTSEGSPEARFDKIHYGDLSPEAEWTRLGKGSFGCVYKGEYLGIEVAIKEVLQSTEYDVEKYLQREITLMQQARHPNIVQYLGLCLAPPPPPTDSEAAPPRPRILIISEFLPSGNLRQYILQRTLPFPWRLRLSFSTDIARALAYLHARNTMHRDLKGENLLVTSNERLKCCDFGLARVAPGGGKEDEAWRRLTYCGTDGYMSPEILLGQPFTLSTDIYSLGILLLEIASRSLASNHTFVRSAPDFGISHSEAWQSVSPACPKAFVELALKCCATEPSERPDTKEILRRLRVIELEVLEIDAQGVSTGDQDAHARGRSIKRKASIAGNVGSISYAGTTKRGSYGALASTRPTRPSAPRLPSFEGQVNLQFGSSFISSATSSSAASHAPEARKVTPVPGHHPRRGDSPGGSEDDDEEALLALADAQVPIEFEQQGEDLTTDSAYFERLRHQQRGGDGDDDDSYSIAVIKPPPSGRSTILSTSRGDRPYGALGSSSGSSLLNTLERGQGSLPSLPPSWVANSREASDDGTRTVIASPADSPEKPRPFAGDDDNDKDEQEKRDVVSYLTRRTSALSVANAVVGSGGRGKRTEPSSSSTALAVENEGQYEYDEDEEESRDVFHSTLESPARLRVAQVYAEADEDTEDADGEEEVVELPHRFSLIKPGLHRLFSSLTSSSYSLPSPPALSTYQAGLTSPSLTASASSTDRRLSFGLPLQGRVESGVIDGSAIREGGVAKERERDGGRCGLCEKKFGIMKAHLVCDDCGLACHIKCSDSIPPLCPSSISALPPLIARATSPSACASTTTTTTTVPSPPPPKPTRAPPSQPLGAVDANALRAAGGGGIGSGAAKEKERERPSKLQKKRVGSGGAVKSG